MTPSSVGDEGTTPSPSAVQRSLELLAVDNAEADSSRSPGELPRELSSFIGREREISEVKRLLSDTRLLTLTGPGGCGKTRLALAVAQDLLEAFEDGVWWVELASLSDPKLVPGAVASALGMREAPDRSLTQALVEHLKPRKSLLILDNCEHLVDGCAVLADTLLRACPELEILTTSREPLRIAGESNFMVPSLSLPDPGGLLPTGELVRYEAVRLFVERAKAVDAGFALTERNASAVARLCQKLDGMPLAIELAAARVRVLSVEQISEKLEDPLGLLTTGSRAAAARHQALRATLEWSYDLLSETERKLFGRLSVFAGGWTLEAAEAVGAGEPVEAGRVLDLLSQLVDKSLVVAEESGEEGVSSLGYRMLEPVRQYALERLVEGGEAEETRRRHAAFFLALAEEAEPKLTTAEQVTWLERLEADHNNLRTVLSWSLGVGEAETALRLGAALSRFWHVRGYSNEGLRWLEEALSLSTKRAESLRARALNGAGHLAWSQGDLDRAKALREESLALSRQAGEKREIANALNGLGIVIRRRGNFEAAHDLHEEALTVSRELDDRWVVAQSIDQLGRAAAFQGTYAAALPRLEEALKMYREVGDRQNIAESTAVIGMVALGRGDYSTASLHLEEARKILSSLGDRRGTGLTKTSLGDAALNRGERDAAHSLYEEALRDLKDVGDKWWIALCLEGMAGLAVAREQSARAARLFGAAAALRLAIGAPRPPAFLSYHERNLAAARDRLGEEAFEKAWEEGRAMSPKQAIEYALAMARPPTPSETTVAMRTPDAWKKDSGGGAPPVFSGVRGGSLRLGEEALARGAWEEARSYFRAALNREETPEALEGLGMSAWWLDDGATAFDARERAYRLYRQSSDDRAAARVATWLAWDYNAFRGEPAIANGWLRRASSLLEDLDTVPEHGWLALREGEIALLLRNDTPAARRLGARAASVGRSLDLIDLEMVGQALEGLARVSEGEVAEGMRRLDEATAAAMAGELTDLCAMGLSSCYLLFACERVHDHDRAAQWCKAVKEFCKRWRIRLLFAICRAHYATSLTYRGDWEEAEAELVAAERELAEVRPGMMVESSVRLGELRRRQGREEEATRLFERFASHPLAQLGLAAVAFDLGDATAAADLVERHLRALHAEDRLERVSGLELAIRARLALNDTVGAGSALTELEEIAAIVDTDPLRASLLFSEGLIAASGSDHDRARRRFEDALDLWTRSGMPFEAAKARLELARTLLALARPDAAVREVRLASEGFASLGAAREQQRSATLLRTLESTPEDSEDGAIDMTSEPSVSYYPAGLSAREAEVLKLVAEGLTNAQVAQRLFISPRTVDRHLNSVYHKIGMSSRAAATRFAIEHHLA